jgi:large subunit ribosomal protein LP2
MKHFAAYALLVLSGKERPSEAEIEKVLTAAGLKGEEGKVAALCAAMKDKDFHAVVEEGLVKMSTMGSAAPAQAAAGGAAETKAEAKKAEPEEEEADMDMGDLFGGDY